MSRSGGDIAIVGMSCIYPGAPNLETFWRNILSKVDAVSDPPEDLGYDDFFDPESTANDRIYSKKGGFIEKYAEFNPVEFGVMPDSVDGSSPEQFMSLRVARDALADAGYLDRPFARERTGLFLGHGLTLERGQITCLQHGMIVDQTLHILKRLHPETSEAELKSIKKELKAGLPPFKADTCPGLISNLLTGRIANRLDLQGPNYTVDAACASSLIALDIGIRELQSYRCDMVIAGGVQASTSPLTFMVFCLLGALSRRGRIRPFDKDADGILLGEGIGMLVIKRREDAERDGDRIYALIKGVGVASDGRAVGVLVPRLEGELLALERAYHASGISPATIGMIEAHGTGTAVGDATEIQAMTRLFGSRNGAFPRCAIGSVKSMISHTIPAAGAAGLIKAALSLHHKVLPPTLCDEPNPDLGLDKSPFYVNTETRPWIHGEPQPRRAGVNAFGFGGINAHAILEEYTRSESVEVSLPLSCQWDTEVIIVQGESREGLIQAGERLLRFVSTNPEAKLKDIAYTLNCPLRESVTYRLAIIAKSSQDLEKRLTYTLQRLVDPECRQIKDRSGIFFFEEPISLEGKLAFLFPGEGSQYGNMLSDLCIQFPEVRACFDLADRLFVENGRYPLPSQVVFPPPHLSAKMCAASERTLWKLQYAVNAVFAANHGLNTLLDKLEIRPQVVVGHSSGEDTALMISGVVVGQDEARILKYDHEINDLPNEQIPVAKLMAVGASNPSDLVSIVDESGGKIYVSMDNCPNQVVLCGSESAIEDACERLKKKGAICNFLSFDRAYHTPWYKPVCDRYSRPFVERLAIKPPRVEIYSCSTARPYPSDVDEIRRIMVEQWALPVRFRETIEAMYDDGVRVFVEVGPRGNLTSFVEDTLGSRDYVSVAANLPTCSGTSQLNHMIGLLGAHGVTMRLDYLYAHRNPKHLPILEGVEKSVVGAEDDKNNEKKKGAMTLSFGIPRLTLDERVCGASASPVLGELRADRMQQSCNLNQVSSPRSEVMQGYLQTMEQFLALQQESMRAFLRKKTTDRTKGSTFDESLTSVFWSAPIAQLPDSSKLRCNLCSETGDGMRPEALAQRILSRGERKTWQLVSGRERRRKEWLLGRMAAKDAVRLLLNDLYQVDVCSADIEILADEYGQPRVSGEPVTRLGCSIFLSIAHSDKTAVAVAGKSGKNWRAVGIDVERVDRNHDGLDEAGFTSGERSLLDTASVSDRKEWLLRLWCAKEAVAKALGRGLMGNSFNIVVQDVDVETGRVKLKVAGQLVRKLRNHGNKSFTAYTGRDKAFVFATSLV